MHGEAEIWLTEQGVVFYQNEKPMRAWKSPLAAEHIMDAFANSHYELTAAHAKGKTNQITNFFYYAVSGDKGFDSGLLEENPSLPVVLKSEREKRVAIAASQPREIYRIYKQKTLHGG